MSIELLQENPEIAKAIKDMIKEASNVKTQIEIHQGTLKDIKSKAKTDYGIDGKTFSKLFNLYHNQARTEFEEQNNELIELYDVIDKA
ncbi:transcriptional regulator [Escherichia phage RB16]|uniref:DsbA dsDNA binding protein late transcription n=1 Tax=Escherichia phage RB16 TaxID=2681599 RepID=D9ICA8_BPRB1|nr:transcriptional regulator [Escherichia phage RB16]ADJ55351.1 DsbA dsDNA binding protein late transcription [Escherichia phage RB16]